MRILLVAAEPDQHRLLTDLLDSLPTTRFLIERAESLADGQTRLQAGRFDACLLAFDLPDGDGLDLLASVETRALILPVVMLASTPSRARDRRAMTLGAAGCLDWDRLDAASLDRTLRYAVHQRKLAERLTHQAFVDEATGLISRALFQDRLKHALAFARRRDRQVAVMIIDLAFSPDGDGDGPMVDAVLAEAGRRLIVSLRETDSTARVADRRLALLIEGMHTPHHAALVARKALRLLGSSLEVDGRTIALAPSVGIAVYPREGDDGETLTRQAEAAMRRAIAEGGACCRFASERVDSEAREGMVLEKAFNIAFEHRDLRLRFHPEVHVKGRSTSLAAEVFWRHPDRGWLAMDDTLCRTDDDRLIKGIAHWSLAAVAEQLLAWGGRGLERARLSLTFPFRRRLTLPLLENAVHEEIGGRDVAPGRIEIDLQDDLVRADAREGFADLARLKATGVRLALDDFGEGRIAIQDLRQDLLNGLKLAPGLYQDGRGDARSETLLRALVHLGRNLDLAVTAKGARDKHQFACLKRLGCDAVRLAALPPMGADAAASWLRSFPADRTGGGLGRSALSAEILVPEKPLPGRAGAKSPPPLAPD